MEELSLHILDIAGNSIRAGATRIEIYINEDLENDTLTIKIKDNGAGIEAGTLKNVHDPFYTTKRGKRVGLGIPLLAHAARQSGGGIRIRSKRGAGTEVIATFKSGHIDRQPLGNIEETLRALLITCPDIEFTFEHRKGKDVITKRWEAR